MHGGRGGSHRDIPHKAFNDLIKEIQSVISLLNGIVNPKGNVARMLHEANRALHLLESMRTHPDAPIIHASLARLEEVKRFLDNAVKVVVGTSRRFDDAVLKAHKLLKKLLDDLASIIEGRPISEDHSEVYHHKHK